MKSIDNLLGCRAHCTERRRLGVRTVTLLSMGILRAESPMCAPRNPGLIEKVSPCRGVGAKPAHFPPPSRGGGAHGQECDQGLRAGGGGQPCLWWSQGCSIGCAECVTDLIGPDEGATGIAPHADKIGFRKRYCNATYNPGTLTNATLPRAVRVVTFSFLCPLLEKYGTFIARCNALIEKVSSFRPGR
eukprot:SAG31_NODE_6895_length_1858_cov_1.828880_1_plen_188_part_00